MQKTNYCLCLILFCGGLFAQDFGISLVNGIVLSDGKAIPDVHVMNTSLNRATITNSEGIFKITGQLGDTLLFSAVQFKRKTIVLNAEILSSTFLQIPLEPFVNELDEVILRPYDLSGDLSNDIRSVNTDNVVSATSLGLPNPFVVPPTQGERMLYEATSGSGLLPLNPVLNALTGRTKYLKNIVARDKKYARAQRVREYYSDSVMIRALNIPLAKLDDFVYFCEVDQKFDSIVDTHDRLKIWEFLKAKSKVYRRNNKLD